MTDIEFSDGTWVDLKKDQWNELPMAVPPVKVMPHPTSDQAATRVLINERGEVEPNGLLVSIPIDQEEA